MLCSVIASDVKTKLSENSRTKLNISIFNILRIIKTLKKPIQNFINVLDEYLKIIKDKNIPNNVFTFKTIKIYKIFINENPKK